MIIKKFRYLITILIGFFVALGFLMAKNNLVSAQGYYWFMGVTEDSNTAGAHCTMPERNYFAPDWNNLPYGYVIQRLLVMDGTNSSGNWLEIGYGHGWHGQNILYFYEARQMGSDTYNEYKINKSLGGNGTLHTYSITNNGSYWNAYIDGTTYLTHLGITNQSSHMECGGEATSNNATAPDAAATSIAKLVSGSWLTWSNRTQVSNSPYTWSWSSSTSGHFYH